MGKLTLANFSKRTLASPSPVTVASELAVAILAKNKEVAWTVYEPQINAYIDDRRRALDAALRGARFVSSPHLWALAKKWVADRDQDWIALQEYLVSYLRWREEWTLGVIFERPVRSSPPSCLDWEKRGLWSRWMFRVQERANEQFERVELEWSP